MEKLTSKQKLEVVKEALENGFVLMGKDTIRETVNRIYSYDKTEKNFNDWLQRQVLKLDREGKSGEDIHAFIDRESQEDIRKGRLKAWLIEKNGYKIVDETIYIMFKEARDNARQETLNKFGLATEREGLIIGE